MSFPLGRPTPLPSQRGVVHFSSVPRDMRPPEVRLHFNKFGTILRMRFVPYPKKERRPGGPLLPLQYKEGYMEFAKAHEAKAAAMAMNATPVDCKRRRKCYGQLWTVKYLEGFLWDSLIEEQEEERRLRRAAEVAARREERDTNEAYRRLVMARSHTRRSGSRRHATPTTEDTDVQADESEVGVQRKELRAKRRRPTEDGKDEKEKENESNACTRARRERDVVHSDGTERSDGEQRRTKPSQPGSASKSTSGGAGRVALQKQLKRTAGEHKAKKPT